MTDNTQEELRGVYKEIVKEKEPDLFIDLLCANHYFAGQFGNKIPVAEARVAFELWLNNHINQQVVQALQEVRIKIADLDQMYEPHTIFDPAIGILDEAIKEYKGDKG